jgi:hypothetical protein
MRLPRRRTFWLSAALLLAVAVAGIWLFAPSNRITQAKFDRIQDGMTAQEVSAILGAEDEGSRFEYFVRLDGRREVRKWSTGPSSVRVRFGNEGKVLSKDIYLATAWETLIWYAKESAEKIGMEWD